MDNLKNCLAVGLSMATPGFFIFWVEDTASELFLLLFSRLYGKM